jgi:Protein of unknown function (DUF3047)
MAEKASGLGALTTLARFAVPRLARYLISGNAITQNASLKSQLAPALQLDSDKSVAASAFHTLDAEAGEWLDTGLSVAPGDVMTILGQGAFWMSKPLDIRLGAGNAVWVRIGDGDLFKVTSDACSFVASTGGRVLLIAAGPGAWENPKGEFLGGEVPTGPQGMIDVALIKWRGQATEGLPELEKASSSPLVEMLTSAVEKVLQPTSPPEGWRYLWRLGEGELYQSAMEDDGSCIRCTTHEDVGILQIPAERPLTDTLTLNWDWIAHQLPSSLPEDIEPTHDYLSIAVEFDNGLDLTYMWSAALPEDTIFQCPLAWWDERETHWVVRTKKDVGRWLAEERSIKQDYKRAIGGDVPAKVVQVWLIANSLFQRGTGKCDYRAIRLTDGEDVLSLS